MTGLCACGCGRQTSIAPKTDRKRGYVKGQAVRFIAGHNHRDLPLAANTYRQAHAPRHPRASASGCVQAHILIAEQALGRFLPPGAEVHHVNGDKADNRPTNLIVCQDAAYHKLLHVRQRTLAAGGNPNTDKVCCDCRVIKPFSEFNAATATKATGLQSHCRACQAIRWAKYNSPR